MRRARQRTFIATSLLIVKKGARRLRDRHQDREAVVKANKDRDASVLTGSSNDGVWLSVLVVYNEGAAGFVCMR